MVWLYNLAKFWNGSSFPMITTVQKAAGKTWHLVTDEIQRAVGLLCFTRRLETSTDVISSDFLSLHSLTSSTDKENYRYTECAFQYLLLSSSCHAQRAYIISSQDTNILPAFMIAFCAYFSSNTRLPSCLCRNTRGLAARNGKCCYVYNARFHEFK